MNALLLAAIANTCTVMGNFTQCSDGTIIWSNGANISQIRTPDNQITNIYKSGNQIRIQQPPAGYNPPVVAPVIAPSPSFGFEPLE